MIPATITISLNETIADINPNLYGHFTEHLGAVIYEGIWVGEDSTIANINGIRTDVVNALKKINPPIIRWPGGCFAEDYHWQDGIGPRQSRPSRGYRQETDLVESNAFGTHEFIQLCRLIGAEPYICGNVGSGTPRELRDWVEYCNFPGDTTLSRQRAANGSKEPFNVRYWAVGNENWGCGGGFCPEDYGSEYKRFANFLHDFGDTRLFLVASGPLGNRPDWTRRFFKKIRGFDRIDGYSPHFYCGTSGTATEYTDEQWYSLIARSVKMEQLLLEQRAVMDAFEPGRSVGIAMDEWGTWHPPCDDPRFQWRQNTLRDALVAGATLDIFNRNSDKVVMGNIAQAVNLLHALILTDNERMITTPTYHVYDMYQSHQGGTSLRASFDADRISFDGLDVKSPGFPPQEENQVFGLDGSASLKGGILTISVVNTHVNEPVDATITLRGGRAKSATVSELTNTDIHAHNTFDAPAVVCPKHTTTEISGSRWVHTFAPASVTVLVVSLAP